MDRRSKVIICSLYAVITGIVLFLMFLSVSQVSTTHNGWLVYVILMVLFAIYILKLAYTGVRDVLRE